MQNANGADRWRAGGMPTNANNKFRSGRTMPAWFQQQQQQQQQQARLMAAGRPAVGGGGLPGREPPPLPPSEPPPLDPDYEVIEFPSQQYINTQPAVKANGAAGGGRRGDGKHCDLCGSSVPAVRCDQCASQIFCYSCDDMYHRHPKRQTHVRRALQTLRPPLPPKGEAPPAPVPPPRRKGRTSRMGTPSPLDGQVNHRHSCLVS